MPIDRTLTAPLAIIKVQGVAIGKIKSVQCTETVRLGRVVGIGRLNPSELDPLDWTGNLNAGAFLIDMTQPVFPGSMPRVAQTIEEWQDTLTLNADGIQIDILRKVYGSVNAQGIITPAYKIVASVKGAFCNRESFDISEGQISGRNVDFEYINPILFPI